MLVETIKLNNGQLLKIYQDEYAESPRTAWDNMGKMICFHGRYNLGDKHNIDHNDYNSFDHMIKKVVGKDGIYLPLYLYDHSGITMSYKPFSCRFDSGQVGFIYMSKEDIIREYGEFTEENKQKALNCLISEVETYDQYLTGEIYSFELVEIETCNLGHNYERQIDSCSGFYGYDHEKSGLFECAGITKKDVA